MLLLVVALSLLGLPFLFVDTVDNVDGPRPARDDYRPEEDAPCAALMRPALLPALSWALPLLL